MQMTTHGTTKRPRLLGVIQLLLYYPLSRTRVSVYDTTKTSPRNHNLLMRFTLLGVILSIHCDMIQSISELGSA